MSQLGNSQAVSPSSQPPTVPLPRASFPGGRRRSRLSSPRRRANPPRPPSPGGRRLHRRSAAVTRITGPRHRAALSHAHVLAASSPSVAAAGGQAAAPRRCAVARTQSQSQSPTSRRPVRQSQPPRRPVLPGSRHKRAATSREPPAEVPNSREDHFILLVLIITSFVITILYLIAKLIISSDRLLHLFISSCFIYIYIYIG